MQSMASPHLSLTDHGLPVLCQPGTNTREKGLSQFEQELVRLEIKHIHGKSEPSTDKRQSFREIPRRDSKKAEMVWCDR